MMAGRPHSIYVALDMMRYRVSKMTIVDKMQKTLFNWWLPIFFALAAFAWYEWGDEQYSLLHRQFNSKLHLLQQKKEAHLVLQAALLQQVNSQSDPEWVEMVLIRQLGLLPEGHEKVFFSGRNSD